MNTISVTYTLIYQLSFANNYQWTKYGKCFNVKTGREIHQILNSGSIGYCINGKFKSLKFLRPKLEKIPKRKRLPF